MAYHSKYVWIYIYTYIYVEYKFSIKFAIVTYINYFRKMNCGLSDILVFKNKSCLTLSPQVLLLNHSEKYTRNQI